MWFKKNNIKKKSSKLINFIWIISILLLIIIWFFIVSNINFINLDILNNSKTNKDFITSGTGTNSNKINKINILIVWIWWWNHDAPNLTDTIILTSIDFNTKIISMLSIPRDLYVDNINWTTWKINKIYASNSSKNDSKKTWMEELSKKIEEITNQKIDYFVNIDFNWFIKLINTLWGIELIIDKQFTDAKYPDWNWWYKTVTFKKWTWLFDWDNALKYARSRHSTSDFDRNLRQQQIIDAVRNKLTAWFFLSSPLKIKELYNIFNKYIFSNIDLQEILKLAIKLKTSNFKLQSFNLNDSCFYWSNSCSKWWLLYVPIRDYFWWASVVLPEWADVNNLSEYEIIHKFANLIFNNPDLFQENYKINILNSLKVNYLASLLTNEIKKYWFNIPEEKSIWNTKIIYEKSIIYYNKIDEKSKTIQALKNFFPEIIFEKINLPKFTTESDINIEIIIWQDYKKIFNGVY